MLEKLKKQELKPLGLHVLFRETFKKHLDRQRLFQEKKRPVGWFFALFPAELAYVFDIINIFPEQYSAYCAAKMRSVELIDAAQQEGYGKFLCDYFKCSVGSILKPEVAPLMGHCGLAPDFVLDSRMGCYGHHVMSQAFCQLYGRKVRRFVLDVPFWTIEKVGRVDQLTKISEKIDRESFDYAISQIHDFISFLEGVTGDRLDKEKMRKVFEISQKSSENFIRIAELSCSKPTPISQMEFRDLPVPAGFFSGSEYALKFSENTKKMVERRVAAKEGIVNEERLRLMSHGIVPWHSSLYRDYEEQGVVFPLNPYIESFFCQVDASKPFESMIRRSFTFTNCETDVWIDSLIKQARRAEIDGAVLFENTGCRPFSLVLRRIREVLWDELGLPSVIVEAPQCDSRGMPIERTRLKINAFVESLL